MKAIKFWTQFEEEKLLLLREDKKSFLEIAKILGRSEGSVTGKYHNLKKNQGSTTWTWKHEETEILIALSETLPFTQLFVRYNKIATSKGYQKRTIAALRCMLFEIGQSCKPSSGWYGILAIAVGLGFSKGKVFSWLKLGLKHTAEGTNFYVRNDHLVDFILSHPKCLNGISDDGVRWFVALLNEEKEMRNHDGRPEFARSLTA